MRHVGQKLALGLARGQRAVHGAFELVGALRDALFEQLLVLAKLFMRGRQVLDHPIEAFAQVLDLVAGAAHLNRLEFSFAHRSDAFLKQAQGARQQANGEARNAARDQSDDEEQHHALGQIERVQSNVPPQRHDDDPQDQQSRENRKLGRERPARARRTVRF